LPIDQDDRGLRATMGNTFRRRAVSDVVLSVGAVAVLLAVLVAMDPRVRQAVLHGGSTGHPTDEVVQVGHRVRVVAQTVYEVGRDQALEHAPLVIFAGCASVLVLFMLRS
jgi:hypothetical protein